MLLGNFKRRVVSLSLRNIHYMYMYCEPSFYKALEASNPKGRNTRGLAPLRLLDPLPTACLCVRGKRSGQFVLLPQISEEALYMYSLCRRGVVFIKSKGECTLRTSRAIIV